MYFANCTVYYVKLCSVVYKVYIKYVLVNNAMQNMCEVYNVQCTMYNVQYTSYPERIISEISSRITCLILQLLCYLVTLSVI